ncbi:hypothetical protein MUGA111182_06675 [Mucilaginibacter galii]|uniref:Uncharacterized protein n=1 Tax=Mucilaginibacter galii TaxID=2005073 RepID=A0A917N295_9SPHI|nr:hypothetical protein [Mucilaginibacter galii]GGI51663.1 hypothetical protein GCM10011425_28750 [Mucilaginibacter galii]
MAKDIKAVQCPHCGSIHKTETKPDFYRCLNCGTEYFLNSDDVHIYHHHNRPAGYSSSPPVNSRLPLYILIGAVFFIVVVYFVSMLFQPKRSSTNTYYTNTTYKAPRSFYSSFVYTNTVTGEPVYLRMGTDYIDKGNNHGEQELHAQFNNALNGKLITDRIITDDVQRKNRCSLTFKTYAPNMIYAIGCNNTLLALDTRNNDIKDVTQEVFKSFSQLSSGVARLDFDYYKAIIKVMNNEGVSYYYFPTLKKLVQTEAQSTEVYRKEFNPHYFEFGYNGSFFDDNKVDQLLEVRVDKKTDDKIKRDLTPGRKYFNPNILYQDADNLLIVVNTTAAADPPVSIQRINVHTGKLEWALPPDKYYLSSATKWKHGFAIEYRKNEQADYVHGVLVVADDGKLVNNYQLGRTE